MEWPESLKNISVLIGIWIAISGVSAWRKQHIGKRKIELAEDALALFYESYDAIKHMRHPASFSNEMESVERAQGETEEAWQARRNASVVFHRYNNYQALFNKLHAMRYRFMAQIGKEEAKPFEDLRKIVNDIIMSARMLARLWARSHFRTDQQWEKHQQQVSKHEAVFWEGLEDEDPINPRLDQVIKNIEAVCKCVIEEQHSIFDILNKPLHKKAKK